MAKDPAVLFYTSDYLTGTRLMTYEQKGKYMDLLCLQHQQGPLSEQDMLEVCGEYDKRIFSKFKKTPDGLYYNKRMERERIKRENYSVSRSQNAKKRQASRILHNSALPSKTVCYAYGKHMLGICKTYAKHMENENNNNNNNNSTTTSNNLLVYSAHARENVENSEISHNSDVENSKIKALFHNADRIPENFDDTVVEFFDKEGLEGDPRDFIAFNNARGWLGVGGEDMLEYDRWQRYAYKWKDEPYYQRERSNNGN